MKVLVTGGAGFIGSHTVDALLRNGHTVRVLDALVPQVHGGGGRPSAHLDRRAELVVGRVEDPATVRAALAGVEAVAHLAASVGVGQSQYQITDYCQANVMGTATVLQAVVDTKVRPHSVVVASSMSVYGEGSYRTAAGSLVFPTTRSAEQLARGDWEFRDRLGQALTPAPTAETKPLRPTSVYAISKRDQEEMVLSVCGAYGIPATALRFFNTYGPRQSLSNPYTGVAAIFCSRLCHNRPPLVFEDGRQVEVLDEVPQALSALAARGLVKNGAAAQGRPPLVPTFDGRQFDRLKADLLRS